MTKTNSKAPLEMAELWKTFDYLDGALIRRATGKPTGYKSKAGYVQVGIHGRVEYAHRIIFMMFYGYLPDEVDHINGDRTDSCIENLRDSVQMTNQWNRKMQVRNKTGYKGVWWSAQKGKWHSTISMNNKKHHLGFFANIEDAADAYMKASLALHGEYSIFYRDSNGIIPLVSTNT